MEFKRPDFFFSLFQKEKLIFILFFAIAVLIRLYW